MILEGLVGLQKVPPSAADRAVDAQSSQQRARDLFGALVTGGLSKAQQETLKQVLAPTVIAGGTGNDALHRIWLHRELTEELGAFLKRRYPSQDLLQQYNVANPCRDRPCYQSRRP